MADPTDTPTAEPTQQSLFGYLGASADAALQAAQDTVEAAVQAAEAAAIQAAQDTVEAAAGAAQTVADALQSIAPLPPAKVFGIRSVPVENGASQSIILDYEDAHGRTQGLLLVPCPVDAPALLGALRRPLGL